MQKHTHLISFAAGTIACATLGLGLGFAQPEKHKDKHADHGMQPENAGGMPDMEKMMAEMMEMGTPGAEHEALGKMLGHWKIEASFGMPGEEAMTGEGKTHTEWILGGRYTMSKIRIDEFMGMPFEGVAITGYDKYTKEYTSVWVDSMSTHMYTSRGSMSDDGTLTMSGKNLTPMGESEMKMVTTFDGDTMVDTFLEKYPGGDWMETGTITSTRLKKGG